MIRSNSVDRSSSHASSQKLTEGDFDAGTVEEIEKHRLAPGRLGGKVVGLLHAWQILQQRLPASIRADIHLPVSYFIGSDEFDHLLEKRELSKYLDVLQGKKGEQGIDFAAVSDAFGKASLSENTRQRLKEALKEIDGIPLIVRSSSILEDQYGTSFAGIYRSIFCPNQGDINSRLQQVEAAIKQVYASAFSPNAIGYRRKMLGIQTPEQMAVLLQVVDGQLHGNYFFPDAAGIAFSRNPYCWTERLDPDDGFIRLVCGLGTRAVQSMEGEYPRLIGISNPRLRPETSAHEIIRYSQHQIDVINVKDGFFETLPADSVLRDNYPASRYITSILREDTIRPVLSNPDPGDQLVVTFDGMIARTRLIEIISSCLQTLAEVSGRFINLEFSLNLDKDGRSRIALLQCRRLVWEDTAGNDAFDSQNVILSTDHFLYAGGEKEIEFVVFIDPDIYSHNLSVQQQSELSRIIRDVNEQLDNTGYFLGGPGRWGSIRPDLGVPIRFSDILNASTLLEVHQSPENLFSSTYGTHFFMDLVDMNIALLAVNPENNNNFLDFDFFRNSVNLIDQFKIKNPLYRESLRIFRLPPNKRLVVATSLAKRKAIAYIRDKAS